MIRVYLSGPMSGHSDGNYPAFHREAARLRAAGYHVENPAEAPQQETWVAYMRVDIAQLVTCDELHLLPGWDMSKGATIERRLAEDLQMPVRLVADG